MDKVYRNRVDNSLWLGKQEAINDSILSAIINIREITMDKDKRYLLETDQMDFKSLEEATKQLLNALKGKEIVEYQTVVK